MEHRGGKQANTEHNWKGWHTNFESADYEPEKKSQKRYENVNMNGPINYININIKRAIYIYNFINPRVKHSSGASLAAENRERQESRESGASLAAGRGNEEEEGRKGAGQTQNRGK